MVGSRISALDSELATESYLPVPAASSSTVILINQTEFAHVQILHVGLPIHGLIGNADMSRGTAGILYLQWRLGRPLVRNESYNR